MFPVHSWIPFRRYPRASSRLVLQASKETALNPSTLPISKRKAIQERVRHRMRSESLLLEEFDCSIEQSHLNSDVIGVDIGALVEKYDSLKIRDQSKQLDMLSERKLNPVPWTIEFVKAFFFEKCPLLKDEIQFIDLRQKLHSPAQWIVVVPIANERHRISACEEFIDFFKNPQLSQLYRHGDAKSDPWVLFDLKSIYVNIMTPEECVRLDLASLWSENDNRPTKTVDPVERLFSAKDDPNYVPRKLLKIVKKLEYQDHKTQHASMSKNRKKKLRHFKSRPIISVKPSSVSIKSNSNVSFVKRALVEKIDKRYVMEGQFKELDGVAEPEIDIGAEGPDQKTLQSIEAEYLAMKSESSALKGRNREARRYRKSIQKHRDELEALSNEECL
ncbi:hypothetical protein MDAP_001715 [Mitosporidium daphniae]|uniref:Uncharacterized protein n=1 Tax=Mitosporidium daphniae TaxID=1485682 RepID=A0A098VUJ8_9MICR|nr:uncharacterized protein DI09_163p40 [Mitosporidium daphniae]KGG52519.1 hypothetical protein DI09_163p40 [Mitosporidium daphniae]|eukprot:XP_013238955.1 uncharacterized protein DI09_163p40 [Mitosporidium daphniae]